MSSFFEGGRLEVYYGAVTFFSSILHNIFLVYHVETFVSIYKIDKTSFWIGEAIFLLWNSLNDPLFGWISDNKYLSKGSYEDVVLKRLKALSWSAPLFGLSFLTFWSVWTYPWIQFIVCLILYDGFLTMIDLHHSALLADLAVSAEKRTHLNFYCSLFSAFGSLSVFLSYLLWNKDNMAVFQKFCLFLSCLSIIGFIWSIRRIKEAYIKKQRVDLQKVESETKSKRSTLEEKSSETDALKGFIKELCGHQNFMWFAAMNLIQVFHCHFNSNFFPLFLETLLVDVSPTVCSILLGLSFVAPHINNLYFLSLCRKYGAYSVIRVLFLVKLGLAIFMCFLGPNNLLFLCIFIASNRIFTEGTCKLLTLVISDLVDEDYVIHSRKQAVSALMFGTSALLSKPGQTFAPLVGTWLLAVHTGHDVFASGNELGSIKNNLDTLDSAGQDSYRLGVFQLLVYIPIACAMLQIMIWSKFNLHGKRLRWIKSLRAGASYATV